MGRIVTHVLVWNTAANGNKIKEVKANYNSLKEAQAQAEHDVEIGVKVIGIEDAKGKQVWKP